MRLFKQICLFLCWFIIFWGGALKLGILQPRIKPISLNCLQFISFLLLFWQSYQLIDILIARKMTVAVYRLKKRRTLWRINLLGMSLILYKIVFISLIDEKFKIWLSKISMNNESEDNKSYVCYYAGYKKLKVIDGFLIFYRVVLILMALVVLKYLLPFLRMVMSDDL